MAKRSKKPKMEDLIVKDHCPSCFGNFARLAKDEKDKPIIKICDYCYTHCIDDDEKLIERRLEVLPSAFMVDFVQTIRLMYKVLKR